MIQALRYAAIAAVLFAAPVLALGNDSYSRDLIIKGPAAPPVGWVQFCKDYPSDCNVQPMEPVALALTPDSLMMLYEVNRHLNHSITYRRDIDHWGYKDSRYVYRGAIGDGDIDKWDYAEDGFGDCEDYALAKRRELMRLGVPRSALLITVVRFTRTVNGQTEIFGHAILMVETDQGELILDIGQDKILRLKDTPYRALKRQSQSDPDQWVSVSNPPEMIGDKNK